MRQCRPNIVVKGSEYDWDTTLEAATLRELHAELRLAPMKFGISSTLLVHELIPRSDQRIHLITDLAVDRYISTRTLEVSREFPVPVCHNDSRRDLPGGGANLAVSLTRTGALKSVVARIGNAENDNLLLKLLSGEGVPTDALLHVAAPWTHLYGKVMAKVQGGVDREILRLDEHVDRNCDTSSAIHLLDKMQERDGDLIVLSRYYTAAKSGLGTELINLLRSRASRQSLPLIGACRVNPLELVGFDAIVMNEAECLNALDKPGAFRIPTSCEVKQFASQCNAKAVVVTTGAQGALLWDDVRQHWHEFPTVACPPGTDPTGAGDVFLASFAACVSRGDRIEDAVAVAVREATAALFAQQRPARLTSRFQMETAHG
jgi:bifunctional ADP-heptose synthase (sugar kinase/adenylyltransferase)